MLGMLCVLCAPGIGQRCRHLLCMKGRGSADAPLPGRCLLQVVQRARQEDLDTVVRYQVAFLRVS